MDQALSADGKTAARCKISSEYETRYRTQTKRFADNNMPSC